MDDDWLEECASGVTSDNIIVVTAARCLRSELSEETLEPGEIESEYSNLCNGVIL